MTVKIVSIIISRVYTKQLKSIYNSTQFQTKWIYLNIYKNVIKHSSDMCWLNVNYFVLLCSLIDILLKF